jgi:glycerophosphoryl diester phosphodiesterase
LLCIGHRGAAGLEPENTLRSIRRALELGADGIEFDVHCAGGEIVVIHDNRLDRTTNGKGLLRRHTLAQLRQLDAGHGERIPLLHELLDLINHRVLLNIELKGRGTALPVLHLLRHYCAARGWTPQNFILSSFNRAELDVLRGTEFPLGILFPRSPRMFRRAARALGAYSIHIARQHANVRLAKRIHAEGLKLFVFTVNDPAEMARMREIGVDGIFTDYPNECAVLKKSSNRTPI